MRATRLLTLLAVFTLLLAAAGCSKQITGSPLADPTAVPLALSEDGFGIVAGFDDAPVRIEIFTEPQCTHCRDLQSDFGDQLADYINIGRIQVTYRPMTFLDSGDEGYSATVANAMFLAAESGDDSGMTGTLFQRFVEVLWLNQDPGGPAFTGEELHELATQAGLPGPVADTVAGDDRPVDIAEMAEANFGLLYDVDPVDTGTPTVYDLESGEKLDIFDNDWLNKLVQS